MADLVWCFSFILAIFSAWNLVFAEKSPPSQESADATKPADAVEPFHRGGGRFAAMREVHGPSTRGGATFEVIVVEFYHSGLLKQNGENLRVYAKKAKSPTPSRLLQYGPGDFCRIAFQIEAGVMDYEIYYGGSGGGVPVPPWTSTAGVLCEVRRYVQCNANSAESVRSAFDSSQPIGTLYQPNVFVSGCPLRTHSGPCLVRYTGTLQIPKAMEIRFFTASQDASFLYIDKKLVTSVSGVHTAWRTAQAKNGAKISLSAGAHQFEYDHVATRAEMTAAALWDLAPTGDDDGEAKANPAMIPGDAFDSERLFFAQASPVYRHESQQSPDFSLRVDRSAPCTESGDQLIQVTFGSSSNGPDVRWDFGDGQTDQGGMVTHVFLGAGIRPIRMVTQGAEISYQIDIQPQTVLNAKELVPYSQLLPPILDYNVRSMPASELRVWIETLLLAVNQIRGTLEEERIAAQEAAMGARVESQASETITNERTGRTETKRPTAAQRRRSRVKLPPPVNPLANTDDPRVATLLAIYTKLAESGVAIFTSDEPATEATLRVRFELAQTLGPILRDQMGDSKNAVTMWDSASAALTDPTLKAQAHLQVVDLAIHDRLDAKMAAGHFAQLQQILGENPAGATGVKYWRVRGDYEAIQGKFDEAKQSYRNAEKLLRSSRQDRNLFAKLGSYERSTEAFLQESRPDEAIRVIREWESEFPATKVDGAIGFFLTQYWMLRGEYRQAISEARTAAALAPDSSYADRALLLAAKSLEAMGQPSKAIAAYQSFLKQYPGSPLIEDAKESIQELESQTAKNAKNAKNKTGKTSGASKAKAKSSARKSVAPEKIAPEKGVSEKGVPKKVAPKRDAK